MKKCTYLIGCSLGLFCTSALWSQQGAAEMRRSFQPVKKHTLMERFEPELALSASERERMREERFAEVKQKMQMLDTMDISERKRQKLLSDIIDKPFSTRLSRNMADGQFEEEK